MKFPRLLAKYGANSRVGCTSIRTGTAVLVAGFDAHGPASATLGSQSCAMAIKRGPSFDPKAFLAKVGDGLTIGKCRKDQIVFSQGDPADSVFYIQKGKVKVTVISEQGKEAVVAILAANEFFGEGSLAGQTQRNASVTTMMESVIVRLDKASVVSVIHREPAFSEMFIAHLLARTIRIEADLID